MLLSIRHLEHLLLFLDSLYILFATITYVMAIELVAVVREIFQPAASDNIKVNFCIAPQLRS